MVFILIGCQDDHKPPIEYEAEKFIHVVRTQDNEKLSEMCVGDLEYLDIDGVFENDRTFTYKIDGYDIDSGDSNIGVAHTTIITYNTSKAYKEYFKNYIKDIRNKVSDNYNIDAEQISEDMLENKVDVKSQRKSVDIIMAYTNDKWKISDISIVEE